MSNGYETVKLVHERTSREQSPIQLAQILRAYDFDSVK